MSVFRKEIEKDISEMISGRQLIRREYRRPGQSEYFYLTKNADGSHNQIDVPDDFGRKWIGKTLPDKIPDNYEITEDMVEHPEKYYIWYTMGDSKVRSEHAKRHGKIFKWDIPPQGGHPGEDYNCRCLAIPYKPPYNKRKNLNYIVDNINLLQGKVDLLNAEIAIMSSWLEAIKEKEINIYKKIKESSIDGAKNGIEGANDNTGLVAQIAGKIKNNPYIELYNSLAGGASGMFATAMAEYNHQKAELSQLFQDKQTIIEQIKNRTKTIYDMLEKIKIMEQEMELINAF